MACSLHLEFHNTSVPSHCMGCPASNDRQFDGGLHGVVIEGVSGALLFAGPNQGLVCIGKSHSPEIGHRIGLDPNNIVKQPETEILHDLTQPEYIVISADDPDGTVVFENAFAGTQPGTTEVILFIKAAKLIPGVIYSSYPGHTAAIAPGVIAGYRVDQ